MLNRAWKALVVFTLILNFGVFVPAHTPDTNEKAAKKERATEFSLKDQFGNEVAFRFPREKISILTIGDKEGAEQLEAWIRPIVEKYGDKIDVQGIAELSAVPGIAKGVVRNIIKKKSKHAVMLDWSGDVAKSYNFKKDSANLFLIDKQGNIVSRQTGAADPAKLANFYKEIDTLLK
jgi:hypothetical protein